VKYGSFNPELVQLCDLEYWCRVGCHEGVAFVPQRLATFRVHAASMTSANRSSLAKTFLMQLDAVVVLSSFLVHPVFEPLRSAAPDAVARLRAKLSRSVRVVHETLSRAQHSGEAAVVSAAWQTARHLNPAIELLQREGASSWAEALRQATKQIRAWPRSRSQLGT
jgi:hypothetical protein